MEVTVSDIVFEDIKNAAISIWEQYDDNFGRRKIQRINSIENVKDNGYLILSMFNSDDLKQMGTYLTLEQSKNYVNEYYQWKHPY